MYQDRRGFLQGINMYVPAMQWSASVDVQAGSVISLGKPVAAGGGIDISTPIGAAPIGYAATPIEFKDTPYGRNIVVAITTAPTGGTAIRIFGEDYLGQPMSETFAIAGATGKKAFYRILGAAIVGTTSAVGAINVARGALLGLPYKGSVEWAKENGVLLDPGTMFGKCIAPDLTDPATGVSGDPRGMYTPTGAPDGVKEYVVNMRVDNGVNASNNGGLHGIRHFPG